MEYGGTAKDAGHMLVLVYTYIWFLASFKCWKVSSHITIQNFDADRFH